MAEALAAVITWGAEALGIEIAAATASAIATATIVVGSAAYAHSRARAAARNARDAFNASLQDHQVMIRSGVAPRVIVYGRDRVSGPVVFAQSTGDKGEFLHLVIALAAHECDAVEKVWFNDVELPAPDGAGFIQSGEFCRTRTVSAVEGTSAASLVLAHAPSRIVSVTCTLPGEGGNGTVGELESGSGYTLTGSTVDFIGAGPPYTVNYEYQLTEPRVRIRTHLGSAGQAADAELVAESAGKWTVEHLGLGICYLYVRLQYDQEIFGQVGLPNISALVRGRRVRDPRSGLTAWSDNAALCTADYLLDAALGLGHAAAELPDAELIAAANVCDETVALDGGGATQARYTINGTVSTAEGRRANLEKLLAASAGSAVWVQGRTLLRAGAHRTPEGTLTESWLAGPVKILPRSRRAELFNAVTGTFIDPAQGYAEVQYPPVTNAGYVAADGGRRIGRDISQPLVNDGRRAQRLGKIALERSRQALTLVAVCNMRAYDTLPTQVLPVTLARYGFSAKLFEVRQRAFDPDARTVTLTLTETDPSVWAWNYGEATVGDPAPNTVLPNPYVAPQALADLQAASGTAHLQRLADGSVITRARVTWAASNDVFVLRGGRIELQWKLDDAADWQQGAPVQGDATDAYAGPLADQRLTLIRVRPVNAAGRSGAWTTLLHQVVGKTEPPSDVPGIGWGLEPFGVRLYWALVPDLDVRMYEVRLGDSWEAGQVLAQVQGNSYLFGVTVAGTYLLHVKALDTSGNYSATAASASVDIAAPQAPLLYYSLASESEVLLWTIPASASAIDYYVIRFGDTWEGSAFLDSTRATGYRRRVDYGGARRYWVAAVDSAGNLGAPALVDVAIAAPGAVAGGRTEVVDNNVLVFWSPPSTGSLPVERYEVRKGASWAAGTVVGSNGNSTFAAVFEQQAGTYSYWIAAYDTAGNVGTPVGIVATVNAPPDYILRDNFESAFAGTLTNMVLDGGALVGPIDTSESWSTHFSSRGWSTPQDQIDAGYPLYLQPSLTSGSYSETFDTGGTIGGATTVTATLASAVLTGAVTVGCQIDHKLNLGDGWTACAAGSSALITASFRYVRVTWTFSCSAGANLIRVTAATVKLHMKLRTDSGTFTISNASAGVAVSFAVAFAAADTPICQADGATALIPIVSYAGGANPTGFTVYLHNPASGVKVTGSGSWTARGY